jgi:hypothetical protein
MKTVFTSNEIAHVWARQSQESGRTTGNGSIYFRNERIYSYGSHFCMARIIGDGKVLITNRGYSVSTSKHLSLVRSAVSHFDRVYVAYPEDSNLVRNLEAFRVTIANLLTDLNNPRKQPKTKELIRGELEYNVNSIGSYLAAVGKTEKDVKKELGNEYKTFEAFREAAMNDQARGELAVKLEKERKARESRDLRERKERNKKSAAALELWKQGGNVNAYQYNWNDLPVALRAIPADETEKEYVQTSQGAIVPYKAAKLLYALIQAGKDIKGHEIGGYTVISLNGVLTIGCHKIERAEVERFANSQTWS